MKLALEYLIREPKVKAEKNPVLLLLHGYGSNEHDLFSFANELPDEYFVIAAQAPYTLQYGSYAWYAINFDTDENKFSDEKQARKSRDLIVEFINQLLEKYPIDAEQVTLLGFSQGAILSYSIALSYPEKVQRVVALSGYLNEALCTENYKTNNFEKLRIFISHGIVDQVIPVGWAQKAPQLLHSLNIPNVYKEYNVGHGVAPQNFVDLKNWLLETGRF